MTRVAIYARYSSDLQDQRSIEDQIRITKERAVREGWNVVQFYTDHELSGASIIGRPGIQQLIQDGLQGKFDILLAEAMDRISRDQEDMAGIYKRMRFASVKMITLTEGEITRLHIGMKGTMNAEFLDDLANKTRRGMRGCIENGKAGGGLTFGYDVVKRLDEKGEPVRGERKINEEQAQIVNRIFRDYIAGKSPKKIAHELNNQGISGPSGIAWGASTIHGNPERGTGIINNELYIGKLVWNRLRYIKDPDTGKRVSRLNPKDQWIVKDVPEMRIVDQETWEKAKKKQAGLKRQGDFWKQQRPKNLFSYLLKCGCCGGGMGKSGAQYIGCSTARNKGTCSNKRTMKLDQLEHEVLDALRLHLMDPELCQVFCDEYTRYMNELRMEQNAQRTSHEVELKRRKQNDERMIQMMIDGVVTVGAMKDKVNANTTRIQELEELLADQSEIRPVLLHPNMGTHYRKEVQRLIESLNDPEHRHESAELIRSLIDKIVLTPTEDGGYAIDLQGDLAGILSMASGRAKPLTDNDELVQQVKMVAGARFELTTFRL